MVMSAQSATSEARKISFGYSGGTGRRLDLPLNARTGARQLRIVAQSGTAKPLLVADDGKAPRMVDSWLAEARLEMADVDLEAEEEGYPAPGDVAKAQAERILRELAVTDPAGSPPAISPTADGNIAISFHNPAIEGIVQILSEQSGSAAVYSTIGGKSRYTCYDAASARELPDTILKGELAKLKSA
jgi:hypothetical protein